MAREIHQTVAVDTEIIQTLLAAQIEQINDKCRIGDVSAQTANQLNRGLNGTAGSQQIVDD